jgi:hypothetical protein
MEGKVYSAVTVKRDEVVSIDEYIRQLVKDEVEAQLSQIQTKFVKIDSDVLSESAIRHLRGLFPHGGESNQVL